MNISKSKRVAVYTFLDDDSINHRQEKTAFRKSLRMSAPMFAAIKEEWEEHRGISVGRPESVVLAQKRILAKFEGMEYVDGQVIPGLSQYLDKDGNFDIKKAINIHMKDIFDGLKTAAETGNAQAGKILLQISGDLVEKTEEKITHAFDIKGTVRRAQKELADWKAAGRMAEVHNEPRLLSDGVHETPEPGTYSDD